MFSYIIDYLHTYFNIGPQSAQEDTNLQLVVQHSIKLVSWMGLGSVRIKLGSKHPLPKASISEPISNTRISKFYCDLMVCTSNKSGQKNLTQNCWKNRDFPMVDFNSY